MSKVPATSVMLCPACQAVSPVGTKTCWLCHAPLSPADEVVAAELVAKNTPRRSPLSEGFFVFLTLACLLLLVVVGIGIWQEDIGLLIPYAILVAFPLVATAVRSLRAAQRGVPVSAMDVFLSLLVSATATVAIVILLVAAAIGALFVYCLYAITHQ
jgi:hypothetical protein